MCQTGLFVATILVLVVGPSGQGATPTFADLGSSVRDPSAPGTSPVTGLASPAAGYASPATGLASPLLLQLDDIATYVGDSNHSIPDKLSLSLTNAESTEEQQGYTYNSYYAPSTVNFHDIYSNNLAMLAEDPILTTTKDEDFHLNNMPSKFVEFHPKTQTVPPVTPPAPMFILNSSLLKNETEETNSTTTTSTSTTTEEPEESSIKVIPIKKDFQRGVLDLLFPAARVRTFKSVFDTFRRLLSHTFR